MTDPTGVRHVSVGTPSGKATPQTERALATSVFAIDASRRVAWAKHFDSESRLDDALRDLNVARHDVEMYRRALSFMSGALDVYSGHGGVENRDAFAVDLAERYGVVLDDAEQEAGRRAARRQLADQIRGSWREVRDKAAQSIAKAAGFGDVNELIGCITELHATAEQRHKWRRMAFALMKFRDEAAQDRRRRRMAA